MKTITKLLQFSHKYVFHGMETKIIVQSRKSLRDNVLEV
ncbi:hypothetical protein FLJC2902T_12300 [Flavobacterium limnosediminis JC2902]|uniref:Uncharacterized protein n=1 Tax=Flavobacterium limnosediminis JC2902 TaxID=1341181 RepID=V6SQB4_9FLAO|nr:hypothetical protein FLJC2902T_12300 [Flavobacterium limnosediminis JC2902]